MAFVNEPFQEIFMEKEKGKEKIKVMFGNSFCFLFSKTSFQKYKEKTMFLYF